MAGLPACRACVKVGPPLSASGPSWAFPLIRSLATGLQVSSWIRLCPPEVRMTAPVQWSQAYQRLPAMIVLVSFRLGLAALKVPMKTAEGAQSGPALLVIVELRISIAPSVWKIAPPCQPVERLPLRVLFVMFMFPSERIAPPTSLDTLPLIVLRTMLVVVFKNE